MSTTDTRQRFAPVAVSIVAVCMQVRSLAELSWVFMLGTGSQLVAIGIVVWELVS